MCGLAAAGSSAVVPSFGRHTCMPRSITVVTSVIAETGAPMRDRFERNAAPAQRILAGFVAAGALGFIEERGGGLRSKRRHQLGELRGHPAPRQRYSLPVTRQNPLESVFRQATD
jgi:hypothetical protein